MSVQPSMQAAAQFGGAMSPAGGRGDLDKTADFKVEIEGIKATTPGDFATGKADFEDGSDDFD